MTGTEPICTCGHRIGHHVFDPMSESVDIECNACPCDVFIEDDTEPLF